MHVPMKTRPLDKKRILWPNHSYTSQLCLSPLPTFLDFLSPHFLWTRAEDLWGKKTIWVVLCPLGPRYPSRQWLLISTCSWGPLQFQSMAPIFTQKWRTSAEAPGHDFFKSVHCPEKIGDFSHINKSNFLTLILLKNNVK